MNINPKLLIISFSIIIFLFLLGISIFNFLKPSLSLKISEFSITETEGEMEFINDNSNEIEFLTYRGTALAKINKDNKEFSLITEQILPQELIQSIYWNNEQKKVLLEVFNEPEVLSGYSTYKKSEAKSVFATLNFDENEPIFLTDGPEFVWMTGKKILGIKEKEIFIYEEKTGNWKKSDLKSNLSKPLLSLGNVFFADLKKNKELTVYDEGLNAKNKVKLKTNSDKNIRIFDNGSVAEIIKESLSVYDGKKILLERTINNEENLLFGKNIIIYSQKNKYYAYMPLESKNYFIKNFPKSVTFLDIFGLNNKSAVYPNDEENTAFLWEFK